MKAYVVITAKTGTARESANAMTALPACRWLTLAGVAAMVTPSWNSRHGPISTRSYWTKCTRCPA